jgi:hypothetical protein
MSSVQASFAQNKSRSFVTVAASGKLVTADQLDALFVTAGADNVGSLYTIYTAAAFNTFTILGSGVTTVVGETLIDLGKQVTVGLDGVDGVLLKLRLVKRTSGGEVDSPIDGDVVYAVVENNVSVSKEVTSHTVLVSAYSRVAVARV